MDVATGVAKEVMTAQFQGEPRLNAVGASAELQVLPGSLPLVPQPIIRQEAPSAALPTPLSEVIIPVNPPPPCEARVLPDSPGEVLRNLADDYANRLPQEAGPKPEQHWNEQQQKLLFRWKIEAEVRHQMHRKAASYYNCWYLALGIPSTILNFFIGPTIVGLSVTQQQIPGALLLIMAVLITVAGLLTSFLLGSKPSEKSQKHEVSASKNMELKQVLEIELATDQHNERALSFIERVAAAFQKIRKTSLRIPERIETSFLDIQTKIVAAESALLRSFDIHRQSVPP